MDLKPKITFPTLGIFAALTLILFFVGRPMMTFHYDHDAVFLFSTRFAADMLSAPGGLSLDAGTFINQFMAMPLLAAILLALIMTDMFPFLMRIGSGKQNAPAMIFTVLTASAFILR